VFFIIFLKVENVVSILPCEDAKIMKIGNREPALTYKKSAIDLFMDFSAAET
jgi:hypothetical protein